MTDDHHQSDLEDDSLFRKLFDLMPQLGWTARADGYIDFYNRGWYTYTGTTYDQMQGWGWKSVHDPELLESVMERWQSSISTGEEFELEFPLRRHDGIFRWFVTRARPLRNEDGSIMRWVGINTDVDDIRAARALGAEVTEQSVAVERMLVELRDAKTQAERRTLELENELSVLRRSDQA